MSRNQHVKLFQVSAHLFAGGMDNRINISAMNTRCLTKSLFEFITDNRFKIVITNLMKPNIVNILLSYQKVILYFL